MTYSLSGFIRQISLKFAQKLCASEIFDKIIGANFPLLVHSKMVHGKVVHIKVLHGKVLHGKVLHGKVLHGKVLHGKVLTNRANFRLE